MDKLNKEEYIDFRKMTSVCDQVADNNWVD